LAVLDKPRGLTVCDLDRARAYRDADDIKAYWINEGYYGIKTEVIHTPANGKHSPAWGVRSNIGPNGFPPRK
jgi:hypothetical protein